MSSKTTVVEKPRYYGEIQPWAKYIKAIFSIISLFVFLTALFGTKHDVRGFFCSLLLSSSPVLIDLLVVHNSISDDENFSLKDKGRIYRALVCSTICFAASMIILLAEGKDITVLTNYLNGQYWQITLLLFPIILYSFFVNTFRRLKQTVEDGVKTEERN